MNNKKSISGKAWLMIGFLFTLTVISNADKAITGFASVPIMKELGLNPEQWGIVGSAFFLLYSLSAILIGGLADRVGTKVVIAGMAIVWALVQFSTIFVSSFTFLIITRIILGAGEGPAYSLAMTAASKWLPKEKLGIGLTLVSVGGPLGVAISAPFLIHLIMTYGWRSAFIATGVVGFIWVVLWLWMTKENPTSEGEQANIKQTIATSTVPTQKFVSAIFSKNFIFIALCGFATYWSFTVGLNWLPNYLENVRKLDAGTLKIVAALPWVMITLSQITFSMISDRLYRKTQNVVKSRIFILGPVLISGAISYYLGTVVSSNILSIILLSLGLTFGCITLVMGPTILFALFAKEHQGKIQGWFMAISSLGGVVGSYVTGYLVQNLGTLEVGFHYSFLLCGALLLVFGCLGWIAVRPKKYTESLHAPFAQSK